MIQELISLGLSEKEARIYAAAVELGTTNVTELAAKSNLKRPTTYLQLAEMARRGLVEEVHMGKKKLYRPVDPSFFEKHISKARESIEMIEQSYVAGQTRSGRPSVQVYEGLDNVRRVYDEMGEETSMRFWSNVQGIQPYFYKDWTHLCERYNKNQTTVREIVADNKEARRWSKYLKGVIGPTYSARTATAEGLHNDGAVSSRALYIFRLHEFNFFVVRIEDATVAATYRALFDMAWKSAKT
ncbi:MAG: helix-turn-helix domain-containing protein, partial [Patescibacteria group bacterium]